MIPHRPKSKCIPNARQEFNGIHGLLQEVRCAQLERLQLDFTIRRGGQDHHRQAGEPLAGPQRAQYRQPTDLGHDNVQE